MTRVVAIVGSYRRDGTTEMAVEEILKGAREKGAVTQTIHLLDEEINFCANCRQCTQIPGESRGKCAQEDALDPILSAVESASALVLASPVNYYNATALFRRFMERLLGHAYWPWGQKAPALRSKLRPRKAVLVATAAMPGFLIPVATGVTRALRLTAQSLGAKPVGKLWIGLAAGEPHPSLSKRMRERARRLGWRLA